MPPSSIDQGAKSMKKHLRPIFWLEIVLAAFAAILLAATFIRNDWIEIVFGIDPDSGSGSFEKLIVGVLLVATLALITLAGIEVRKARAVVA
jgi:hypothetical protein